VAETACIPIGSALVVKLADPATRSALPSDVPPAENVMLPDGKPVPELGITLAISTTGLPSVGAAGDAESVVVVDGCRHTFPPTATYCDEDGAECNHRESEKKMSTAPRQQKHQ
jgi:hypothetical protein